MPRIYVDTGLDAFDINMQMDDDGKGMHVKIMCSDGVVYSGRLVENDKEPMSPPEEIKPV